jgi:uncharacterized protein (TIGR03083 family)
VLQAFVAYGPAVPGADGQHPWGEAMSDISWLGPAIDVRPLFAKQHVAFIDLLRQLTTDEWLRPTICPGWTVKDIAAHVLGDHIGRLSMHRDGDGFRVLHPRGAEPFTVYLDRINEEWVVTARRISPPLLIDLLSTVGEQIVRFWSTVDLDALGARVRWAGPGRCPFWLDAARDFSEYWTHHQQICDATGRTGLMDSEYLGPVLDTFMRALPHTLRNVTVPEGTVLEVIVTGPGGGTWTCVRGSERWKIQHQSSPAPTARIELSAETTWRLCTRGITPEQAVAHVHISGDQSLATAALQIVSIMWTPPDGQDE